VLTPAFARAVNLPKVANFFFVLFLFGKEKGHLHARISHLIAEKVMPFL